PSACLSRTSQPRSPLLLLPAPRLARPTLFPYTTLFRSGWVKKLFEDFGAGGDGNSPAGRMAKSEFAKIAKHAARLMHQKLSEREDRKSTRLNSSHVSMSYAVFCLQRKKSEN